MEVIDIGLNDLEPISLNFGDDMSSGPKPSVNFGSGIELLMNDKKKTASSNVNIDLGELDQLENELNELSGISSGGSKGNSYSASSSSETKTLSGFASNLFGFGNSSSQKPNTNNNEKTDSKIGSATAESIGNNKTWDGFTKVNEIPFDKSSSSAKMTDREKRRKKRAMIKNWKNGMKKD